MTEPESNGRREFLITAGGAVLATTLAGCSGGGDGGDGSGDGGNGGSSDQNFVDDEPDYGGHFDNADNYEGTVDATGQDSVTVEVGAGSDGLAFAPPAIAVDAGTTVTWEWTGQGGQHNVAFNDLDVESETVGEEGHTFDHTFEETGTFLYVCTPHESLGMKGAVDVR